jgi:hypothetical protein
MKGKRLVNISLITLLTISIVAILGPTTVVADNPPVASYIVPAAVIKDATSVCQYNGTTFTVEVIGENFEGVGGFQIVVTYNSTLLAVTDVDLDTGTPMSSSQMAPAVDDRTDTDNSVSGTVQIATSWKAATPLYSDSGNSTMAEITFMIIYCPSPRPIAPAPPLTVSCVLDNVAGQYGTKLVDDLGDDMLFQTVNDGYYEYNLLPLTPGEPDPDFYWTPPFPNPSDTVVLYDDSDPVGDGDFITAWQWEISGVGSLLTPLVDTITWDYYVCAGYNMTPTPPAPAPDPAGLDVTFYSVMNNNNRSLTAAPVFDFGMISTWGGRSYLFSGVDGAPGIMGGQVDIQNLLGYDITILDLTVELVAHSPDPDYSYNGSMILVENLDPDNGAGNYDEVDYTPGNETVIVKRMPDMIAGVPQDRYHMLLSPPRDDPPGYPTGEASLLLPDWNGDAAATGHVAPVALADGDTFEEFFAPVIRSQIITNETDPFQFDGTLRFRLTYTADVATGPTAEFHCDGAGDVEVTLTVWDNEEQSASETKTITQTEAPAAEVDVWTSGTRFCGQITTNYGKGFGAPADAISPDVNVTFYALVTWGGAPLAHRLVGFEIIDNQGQNVVTRTAETDKQGVARLWFRMPLMNPPDQIFGTWNLTVSVKIQDVKVYDYLPFKVGWVVTITGKWEDKETYDIGNPDGSATDGDFIDVTVELKNIMMMPKEYYLAVTIYDDCDVPILKLQDSGVIEAESPWCSPTVINVTLRGRIPHWAYVGVGKVYANVYTAPPFDCGTPYSPEVANQIQLVWTGELFTDP